MKTTILYVDDEPLNLLLFTQLFGKTCNIITANSGIEGLGKLEENSSISIVFSDMKMPYMTGLEFIAQAKEKYPDKSFFLITGYDITNEICSAIQNNLIIKCFTKPFDVESIREVIAESSN